MRKTIVASILLAPSLAFASGYALPNTNPRDLGVCASAVAAQRDSAAAFALPAALARLDGPSAGVSFGGVHVFNTWKDPTTGQKVDMDQAYSPLGSLNAAYGGKLAMAGNRGWGVGLGIQPFGGAIVSWPSGWPGRYRILDVDRKVFSGVATAGIEVLPMVRIGGGFVYYYTTEKLSQNAWMAPFKGPTPADVANPATWDPTLPDAKGTIDISGGAASFDVSAEIGPILDIPLTIAVDYKHKATQTLDGDVTWEGLTPLAAALGNANAGAAAIFKNQGAKEKLVIPNTLNIGAAYRVIKPLLVTATFTLDRWVVYGEDRFIGDNGAQLTLPRDYKNGQTYRAGVEYDLASAVQLRAGVQRDISGLNKSLYSPTLPDASSWGGSLGATYKFRHGVSADAAVFYAKMDKVRVPDTAAGFEPQRNPPIVTPSPTKTFRGEYTPSALVYGVSVKWTPPARHGG